MGFEPEVIDLKNVDIQHFEVSIVLSREQIEFQSFCFRILEKVTLQITQFDS